MEDEYSNWPLRHLKPQKLSLKEHLEDGLPRFKEHGRGFLMFLGGVLILELIVNLIWRIPPDRIGAPVALGAIYAITLFLALRD